jgi:hypothetical protein
MRRQKWPPPPAVRELLERARHRYHELPPQRRPRLDRRGAIGLFPKGDLVVLAVAGWWPLSARIRRWIARSPDRVSWPAHPLEARVLSVLQESRQELVDEILGSLAPRLVGIIARALEARERGRRL